VGDQCVAFEPDLLVADVLGVWSRIGCGLELVRHGKISRYAAGYEECMNIQKPKFTLNEVCPVCGQGEALVFLTCPDCRAVTIVCGEEGSVFPDPKDLARRPTWACQPWESTATQCPHCGMTVEFTFSTGAEIQALGFTPRQYS
jgi:hypothetical protein